MMPSTDLVMGLALVAEMPAASPAWLRPSILGCPGVAAQSCEAAPCAQGAAGGESPVADWEMNHDLRTAHLQLPTGPPAGIAQALRDANRENLGQARHQAGRVLDRADRRRQQRPLLLIGLAIDGGPRANWTAFQADPAWIAARSDSERDGPILSNVKSMFLQPTAFSSVR